MKNGSKTWAAGLLVHAEAGVGDGQLDESVLGVARADRQRAAVGHRIAAVDDEIDEHLLDLAWVGTNGAEHRRGEDVELDVVAEQALQEGADLGHDGVQVERTRIQHLASSEGEQLLRQLGRPVGGALDLAEVACEARRRRWPVRAAARRSR